MRVLIFAVLALIMAVASASPAARSAEFDGLLFQRFMKQHNKIYESKSEYTRRFAVFQAHLDLVSQHNAEFAAGKHSFKLGMTRFADMTNAEYRQQVLGYQASNKRMGAPLVHAEPSAKRLSALPASMDWRTQNAVTPVKDQGQCGSCWSFSSTGGMEGAHALATKNLVSLSEEMLVNCVANGTFTCDLGGEMSVAFEYVIAVGGEMSEADYPYTGQSPPNSCAFNPAKVVAKFSSYANVTSGSETALLSAAAQQPVSVAIDASSIWFQLYSSGVYDDSSCQNGINDLDHGVLVAGYGHDAASGKDYWLVKNSWNTSWGQAGYIWMVRNKNNQCGIATDASYPIV